MELTDAIERRASVRQFSDAEVTNDDLREMVRLAHLAPSINNSQPWKFIVVKNPELRKAMAEAVQAKIDQMLPDSEEEKQKTAKREVIWFSTHFADAPAVIAVLMEPYEAVVDAVLPKTGMTHEQMNAIRGRPDIESIGAAVENLLLAAVDRGYGACWKSGPLVARDELERLLGVQEPWRLEALVAVGKPAVELKQRVKKPLEEVLSFEI